MIVSGRTAWLGPGQRTQYLEERWNWLWRCVRVADLYGAFELSTAAYCSIQSNTRESAGWNTRHFLKHGWLGIGTMRRLLIAVENEYPISHGRLTMQQAEKPMNTRF